MTDKSIPNSNEFGFRQFILDPKTSVKTYLSQSLLDQKPGNMDNHNQHLYPSPAYAQYSTPSNHEANHYGGIAHSTNSAYSVSPQPDDVSMYSSFSHQQAQHQDTKGQTSYATDVGSGLLIGFMGRFDAKINCLAAVFLKPMETTYVDNIKYPNLDLADTSSLTLRTLATAEPQWNGSPYVFKFSGTETDQTITTFNNKMGFEMGVEVTYKAGVPTAMWETKVGLKMSYAHDWGHSTSKSAGLTWNTEHKIEKPEDAIKCTAAVYEGKLDIKYTGNFHVVTKDDGTFAFPTKGTLQQVAFSKVLVSVEQLAGSGKDAEKRSLEDPEEQNGPAERKSDEDGVDHEITEVDEDTPAGEADDAETEEAGQQEDPADDDVEEIEPVDGTVDGIVKDDQDQDQDVDEAAEDDEEGLVEEDEAGDFEAEEEAAAGEDDEAVPEEEEAVDLEAEEEVVADDEEAGEVDAEEEQAAEEAEEAVLEEEAVDPEAEAEAEEEEEEEEEEDEETAEDTDEALPEEEEASDLEAAEDDADARDEDAVAVVVVVVEEEEEEEEEEEVAEVT